MTSLRHLRSDTANKRPDPAALSTGQVAINYESGSPGLFFKDSAGNLVKAGPVHIGTTAPNAVPASGGSTGNAVGEFWLDTTGGAYNLKVWDGTAWRSAAGEYVNVTGDTMTGDLTLDGANLIFEGATADAFETTLTVVDPTGDRTITLPDVSGTVVTTGDTGTVTSAMIANDTLVDADINSSAAIAHSKLASMTAGNILLGNSSNVPTSTAVTGDVTINNVGVTAISAGAIVNADISASAEIAVSKLQDGSARQLLQTDAAGTGVEWTSSVYVPGALGVSGTTTLESALEVPTVGIGTSSPSKLLHIATSSDNEGITLQKSSVSGGQGTRISFQQNNTSASSVEIAAIKSDQVNATAGSEAGGLTLFTKNTTDGSPQARLRITSTGAVGIGTSAPASKLHVSQSYSAPTGGHAAESYLLVSNSGSANNYTGIEIAAGNNGGSYFHFGDTDDSDVGAIAYIHADDSMRFLTNAQERARIDSSGRLLVGTVSSPAYQLQLATDSAGKPSTNTWTIVSDERIKEEIEFADLDLCYEAVKNIPLKRFKWKDEVYTEEQAYDRRKLGWIAQDVEAVFPKAVRQHEFKYNQVFEEVVIPAVPAELDDDGNIITEEQPERIEKGELISEEVIEDCRDLNSDQLYAAMYGAVQKLISKVELLEAEVQALKAA